MCLGNQRAFRVLTVLVSARKRGAAERWDEHLSRTPGLASCESGMPVSAESAGIPGVAVLVCARKRGARSDGMSTYPVHLAGASFVGVVSRKSAGIPGVAVLVCARKRGARSDGMSTYPVHLA